MIVLPVARMLQMQLRMRTEPDTISRTSRVQITLLEVLCWDAQYWRVVDDLCSWTRNEMLKRAHAEMGE
jgi:hypothetical protein